MTGGSKAKGRSFERVGRRSRSVRGVVVQVQNKSDKNTKNAPLGSRSQELHNADPGLMLPTLTMLLTAVSML